MLWRIILALFFSDESLTKYDLAAELSVEPSEVNRVIYRNQPNIFLKSGVKIGTSLPLWALTEPVHSELDRILMTREDVPTKIPDIFCDGALDGGKKCNSLMPRGFCTRDGCDQNPLPRGATYVPPEISGGAGKSILQVVGYSAGKNTKATRRHGLLLQALRATFWTPENAKNAIYVRSFGEPNTKIRCHRLIELLQGFNVAMPLEARSVDIQYLTDYCRESHIA